ncbi:MAG: hypothetical protein ACYTGB_01820 [Planctomycetota bacterium]|jgi:hypothetical protein
MAGRVWLICALLAAGSLASAGERVGDPAGEKPLVIVYPLVSKFDDGKLGLRLRECFRGHALRSGSITCFDRISEEELLEASPLKAEPGSRLEKVADHARATFKARYAIWGEVTRAGKGYKLMLLGAIVEPEKKPGQPGARLAADERYDAENVHFFPQHAETFLAKLLSKDRRNLERKFGEVVKVLEEIPINGDFSRANEKGDWPAGWGLVRPDLRPQVSWVQRPGGKAGDKCVLYDMNAKTAASEGIMLASAYFPAEKDAYYQASVEIVSAKPKMIFWVRGYTTIDGDRRETYRHQVRFYPEKKGEFERLTTKPFKPRNPLVKIEEIRVMLYAYHPAGKIWFDNAWLKRVEVTGDEQPDPAFVKEGGGKKLK